MGDPQWKPEDPDEFYDDGWCPRCQGEGWLMVCIDDICHGQGWCMHGDGDIPCPECNGSGMDPICPSNAPRDWPGPARFDDELAEVKDELRKVTEERDSLDAQLEDALAELAKHEQSGQGVSE